MPSPFAVLGVDPGADEDTIHRAYRAQVKDAHPDQGGSIEEFRALQAASETLLENVRDGPFPADSTRPQATRTVTVEYLDFEAMVDRDWTITDPSLFEKARSAALNEFDYGRLSVPPDASLLESAEDCGRSWPFSCRGGACANCAVAVHSGELSQPVNHILPDAAIERGIRLSCVGKPLTDTLQVVYNVKHLPSIADLRLPPRPVDRQATD